jgi:anti-anti-sigma factor
VTAWSARYNHLRFVVERGDGRATVRLAGEVDCASAAIAHLALERAGSDAIEIVLDVSRVSFLDASGLRFLLSAQQRARAGNRRLVIRRPSRTVRRMLELTGALRLLNVEDSDNPRPRPPAPELTRILGAAIESAMEIAQADKSTAQIVEPTTGALQIVAQRGFTTAFLDYFDTVDGEEAASGTALHRNQPVWVPDVGRSRIFADTPTLEMILDAGVRAVASLPLRSPEWQPIAILSVHHSRRTDWTAEQKLQLEQLARLTAPHCLQALRSPLGGLGSVPTGKTSIPPAGPSNAL